MRRGDRVTHLLEGWTGTVDTLTPDEVLVIWDGHKAGWASREDLKNV